MSLLFNMLSSLVIAFLPRSKYLLILWLQAPSALILEPKKIKSVTVSTFPNLFAMKWWDWIAWSSFFVCWILIQLFTLIRRLFSSSSLYDIRMVSSTYMRFLIFLPAMLIPACDSSSPDFPMMYSAYNLNKRSMIYNLDVLLSQFGPSLLFHVWL